MENCEVSASLKRVILTIVILTALLGSRAECEWHEHHTIVYLSYVEGLDQQDVWLSLATDNVTAFNFEYMPDVSLVHEFETEMFVSGGDLELLWKGDKDKSRLLAGRTNADIIIVARHRRISGDKIASRFRVNYMPLDGTVRSAVFELRTDAESVTDFQKDVFSELVERLPLRLDANFWDGRELAADWHVFYLFGEGVSLLRNDRIEAGLNTLRSALHENAFRDLNYFLGKFFVTRQFNFQLATKYLTAIIKEHPDDPGARYQLGLAYRLMGEYDRAAEQLEKTVAIKPGFLEAYIYLGTIYTDLGDLDKVIHNYKAALEIAPFMPSVWYSLASVQALTGNAQDALFSLRRCLELDAETFYRLAGSDTDFASIRHTAEFNQLLSGYKP